MSEEYTIVEDDEYTIIDDGPKDSTIQAYAILIRKSILDTDRYKKLLDEYKAKHR